MMPTDRTKRVVSVSLVSLMVLGAILVAVNMTVKQNASTKAVQSIVQSKAAAAPRPMETLQQSTTTLYYTNTTFVNLNKDCAVFTDTMFIQAVMGSMQWGGVTDTVIVSAIACGSMTVYFQCGSTSITQAQTNCFALRSALQNKGVGLNSVLMVTLPDTFNPDGTSNNGIYALYTLIALPIFCCAGFLLWYRMKQSQADSQYLQDTATFSNVAARQPHPPYDPAAIPTPMSYQPTYQPTMQMPIYSETVPQYAPPMPQYAPPMPQYDMGVQYAQPMPQYAPAPVGYGYP